MLRLLTHNYTEEDYLFLMQALDSVLPRECEGCPTCGFRHACADLYKLAQYLDEECVSKGIYGVGSTKWE